MSCTQFCPKAIAPTYSIAGLKRAMMSRALAEARMTATLFLLQRASAAVLAFAVTVHLATILYAVRGGLTAGEVLGRTRGSGLVPRLLRRVRSGGGDPRADRPAQHPARMDGVARAHARRRAGRVRGAAARPRFAGSVRGVPMIRASHTQPGFIAALLHRLAGIALAIFLPIHFLALATALNGAAALDLFLHATSHPLLKISEGAIVVALALHMALGLRVLTIEFLPIRERTRVAVSICLAAAIAVGLVFLLNVD